LWLSNPRFQFKGKIISLPNASMRLPCKHQTQTSRETQRNILGTHVLQIIIPIPSRTTSSRLSSSTPSSFLTTSCRAKIRTICSSLPSRLSRPRLWCLLLQHLHLVMQLCSQLFVLVRELAHPVLRNPVIPPVFHHVVSKHILCLIFIFFPQEREPLLQMREKMMEEVGWVVFDICLT
jgi:hypothetical protein